VQAFCERHCEQHCERHSFPERLCVARGAWRKLHVCAMAHAARAVTCYVKPSVTLAGTPLGATGRLENRVMLPPHSSSIIAAALSPPNWRGRNQARCEDAPAAMLNDAYAQRRSCTSLPPCLRMPRCFVRSTQALVDPLACPTAQPWGAWGLWYQRLQTANTRARAASLARAAPAGPTHTAAPPLARRATCTAAPCPSTCGTWGSRAAPAPRRSSAGTACGRNP
jgi:hypothetical protein